MEPATPILAYASDTGPAPARAYWREDGQGRFELAVPPPPVWRLVVGPALALAFLTPLLAFGFLWMAVTFTDSLVGGLLALAVVAAGVGAWSGAMAQLVRTARHGRAPFTLSGDRGGFEIADPRGNLTPHDAAGVRHAARVTYARFFPLHHGVNHGWARLLIRLENGQTLTADVPVYFDRSLQPVEDRLQAAFGVSALPGAGEMTETPCES